MSSLSILGLMSVEVRSLRPIGVEHVCMCVCVCMCACVCSFDAEDDGQHGQHRNGTKSMAIRTQNCAFQPR